MGRNDLEDDPFNRTVDVGELLERGRADEPKTPSNGERVVEIANAGLEMGRRALDFTVERFVALSLREKVATVLAATSLVAGGMVVASGGDADVATKSPIASTKPGVSVPSARPKKPTQRAVAAQQLKQFVPTGLSCDKPVTLANMTITGTADVQFMLRDKKKGTKLLTVPNGAVGKNTLPQVGMADVLRVKSCTDPIALARSTKIAGNTITVDPGAVQEIPTFVGDAARRATFSMMPTQSVWGSIDLKSVDAYTPDSAARVGTALRRFGDPRDSSLRNLAVATLQSEALKKLDRAETRVDINGVLKGLENPKSRAATEKAVNRLPFKTRLDVYALAALKKGLVNQLKAEHIDPKQVKIVFGNAGRTGDMSKQFAATHPKRNSPTQKLGYRLDVNKPQIGRVVR